MYGGSHYIASASENSTPQGRAIKDASRRFGDGKTLPFTPCKKYYNPYCLPKDQEGGDCGDSSVGEDRIRMYGCRLHHEMRKRRLAREAGRWRKGEKKLSDFWSDDEGSEKGDEKDGVEFGNGKKRKLKKVKEETLPNGRLIGNTVKVEQRMLNHSPATPNS